MSLATTHPPRFALGCALTLALSSLPCAVIADSPCRTVWPGLVAPLDVIEAMKATDDGRTVSVERRCEPGLHREVEAQQARPNVSQWQLQVAGVPDFEQQLAPANLARSRELLSFHFKANANRSMLHRFDEAPPNPPTLSEERLVDAIDRQFPGFALACASSPPGSQTLVRLRKRAARLFGGKVIERGIEKPMRSEQAARRAFDRFAASLASITRPARIVGSREVVRDQYWYGTTWIWRLDEYFDLDLRLTSENDEWSVQIDRVPRPRH